MIINGSELYAAQPILNMLSEKQTAHGVSHGLSEVGYDLRVKQEIRWTPPDPMDFLYWADRLKNDRYTGIEHIKEQMNKAFFGYTSVDGVTSVGRTALASSIEEFRIPNHLWGELRNKSTHARKFNDWTIGTDMEPGWKGFLTIEVIFHANEPIEIVAGSGVAKAVFHEIKEIREYNGKYQNQEDKPVEAIYK